MCVRVCACVRACVRACVCVCVCVVFSDCHGAVDPETVPEYNHNPSAPENNWYE